MDSYFSSFPVVQYRGTYAPNILAAVRMSIDMRRSASLYHPFTIPDGDRPDTIAELYYGNPEADWIIYMANSIVDIEAQWPMNAEVFAAYMHRKYGPESAQYGIRHYKLRNDIPSISEAQYQGINEDMRKYWSYDVNTKRMHISNIAATITPEGWANLTPGERVYWKPVSFYTYEFELNEARRNIRLIDKKYYNELQDELKRVLNEQQ